MPKFDPESSDPKEILTLVIAAMAAHALIQRPNVKTEGSMTDAIIAASFSFAEKFVAEAEKR